MEFYQYTLANGLRVIHYPSNGSPVSHCGIILNVGSRDEQAHEQGLAHYIEHCLFKGTKKRKAFHILNRLDAVGGELNAYTSKEETCIYASFLNEHLDRAVELLSDITFHSTFPVKEIEREKEVILDEINSYLDAPSEQIFDDFEDQLFTGHSIGRNILGNSDSLSSFKQKDLQQFFSNHYHPSNAVFSFVGSASPKKVRKILEKYLANSTVGQTQLKRLPFSGYQPKSVVVDKEVHQAHRIVGNLAYSASDKKRTPTVLLNNILGGPGMNTRLNLNIREKYGFAYHLESSYTPYTDTGTFIIYIGTDPKSLKKTTHLVEKELKKLKEKKLGIVQLHSAKQQLLGQIALGRESKVNVMLSIAKSQLLFDKVNTLEDIAKKIEAITGEQLLEVANEIFTTDQQSALTFLP